MRNVNRKRLHGRGDRGHGFGMVAPRELRRSRGAASYYAWSARPGLRFISLDTVGEGGGPDGSIDHPQYRWLARDHIERARATRAARPGAARPPP